MMTYKELLQQLQHYKELLQQLQQLNEEQLNQDVCVYDTGTDEYYQLNVELVFATEECDILDTDHPIVRFRWDVPDVKPAQYTPQTPSGGATITK